ncbi:hypothetical protein TPHA_0C01770 [Tetrapisispora phaffii CBS 4417]|uniref:Ketopantoate reductase C-terminal domain-containing protein n=1 Tax=Tetrapisispora phaffii (strain ATCC 24235 / CBS 4417 / NBRC 1672 / NRRL Y-8282 / UCD 70-5) TaxID=1071381 RepID=G8BRF7_TETPH|nr:hypothetical protein TPHA_0C01770 [Tetrapisispora phaffii CBS 4417]CCE62333.1 hypothetical protein TPHA_0C01770 [Tetrapisispora phaffii CBS 4417]
MASSSLNVLIFCNNPNVLLYASRFQLAKSIKLFHINNSSSNLFEIETFNYGREQVDMKNHFSSVQAMKDELNDSSLVFDMVIFSANSLQDISSISSQMKSVINSNTKIIIESSGFIQLEPFIRMSTDIPASNVFSIITDFDIREVAPNEFKQFPNSNNSLVNTLYLGCTKPNQIILLMPNITKNIITLLETFERLFKKLFPHDNIDLCDFVENNFLTQQWIFALPKICFDPLLVIFDEQTPKQLTNQILAKHLISGLVTELIAVSKAMGAKLPSSMSTESNLINYWENLYPQKDDIPSLVFNFINVFSSLSTDVLLLQPILLADDSGIKTPYLEFLYSVFCQYEKINKGESKWFMRINNSNDNKEKIQKLSIERDDLRNDITKLNEILASKDRELGIAKNMELQNKNEVTVLQREVSTLKSELANQSRSYKNEISELLSLQNQQQLQQKEHLERLENQTNDSFSKDTSSSNLKKETQYKATGTPLINDFEDLAIYSYDSPTRDHTLSKDRTSMMPPSRNGNYSQSNSPAASLEEISASSPDPSIQKKELELKKRELELQERELDFQRRSMQQQQRLMMTTPVNSAPMNIPMNAPMNVPMNVPMNAPMNAPMKGQNNQLYGANNANRKLSHTQLQQPVNTRPIRSMYGASNSSGNFVDPIGSSMMNGMPGNYGNVHSQQGVKPTSRKNRNSTMPTLGHASSLGLSGMANQNNGQNQPRITSYSSSNLANQGRPRQKSQQQPPQQQPLQFTQTPNSYNNANRTNMPKSNKTNSFIIGNQQIGGGSNNNDSNYPQNSNDTNPNVSMSSVVHNPINSSNNNIANNSFSDFSKLQQASVPVLSVSTTPPALDKTVASLENDNQTDKASDNEKLPEKKKKFKLFGKKK